MRCPWPGVGFLPPVHTFVSVSHPFGGLVPSFCLLPARRESWPGRRPPSPAELGTPRGSLRNSPLLSSPLSLPLSLALISKPTSWTHGDTPVFLEVTSCSTPCFLRAPSCLFHPVSPSLIHVGLLGASPWWAGVAPLCGVTRAGLPGKTSSPSFLYGSRLGPGVERNAEFAWILNLNCGRTGPVGGGPVAASELCGPGKWPPLWPPLWSSPPPPGEDRGPAWLLGCWEQE